MRGRLDISANGIRRVPTTDDLNQQPFKYGGDRNMRPESFRHRLNRYSIYSNWMSNERMRLCREEEARERYLELEEDDGLSGKYRITG